MIAEAIVATGVRFMAKPERHVVFTAKVSYLEAVVTIVILLVMSVDRIWQVTVAAIVSNASCYK